MISAAYQYEPNILEENILWKAIINRTIRMARLLIATAREAFARA